MTRRGLLLMFFPRRSASKQEAEHSDRRPADDLE
jgi:hypothetical protein